MLEFRCTEDRKTRPDRTLTPHPNRSDMNHPKKLISIVSPCYNEERSIEECCDIVRNIMEQKLPDYDYEHIFCDNASTDRTVEILKARAANDRRIKIIVNNRNFGILKSNYNGVMATSGDAVVLFMPVDLQDPPDLIVEFVRHWEHGLEAVYGIRMTREENVFTRTLRNLYYLLLSKISYVDYPQRVGDFQLVDRKVVDAMRRIDDSQPFMRMMAFELGFRAKGIPYTWARRKYGTSRNSLMSMVNQGLNGLTSYSTIPIRMCLLIGFVLSFLSLAYAVAVFTLALLGLVTAPRGVVTIIMAIFFFGGLNLFFMGVIGEYIVYIFNQTRRKPLVVERERVNF
jgi:polyisoprenyl-phosphate glycosyltransferase